MDTIDKNEPWKYLWKYDELVKDDNKFVEFSKKFEDDVFFYPIAHNTRMIYDEFAKVFHLAGHDVDTYYLIFKYLGKDPESMMRYLTELYYVDYL